MTVHSAPKQQDIYQDNEGTWFFRRYEDVKLMLSDPRFTRRPPIGAGFVNQEKAQTVFDDMISKWSVFNDPPEHTRLREILSVLISPRFVKESKAIIENVAEELLGLLLQKRSTDFMEAFASALPVAVIKKFLGTDLDMITIRTWSQGIAKAFDQGTPEDFLNATPIVESMRHYFNDLISAREQEPNNDWISDLISIKNTYQLQNDEITSLCSFLLFAGQETVQLTIGLALIALLKHPKQLHLLQQEPELVHSAVEEILRFHTPLNKLCRWTSEKMVVNGVTIPKNQLIVGLISEANCDPSRFENPLDFDITRSNNRHLTFGGGIHHCLGAMLARFEIQIALAKLTPHLHQFSLIEDEMDWLSITSFKYLNKLPINIGSTS